MASPPLSRIRITPPEDWQDLSTYTFISPHGEEFHANVLVTHEASDGGDVESYVELKLDDLQRELESYELRERKTLTVGGKPAISVEHTFRDLDGEFLVRQLQVYVVAGDTAYTLSLTDLDEQLDAQRPAFAAMVAGLRFVD